MLCVILTSYTGSTPDRWLRRSRRKQRSSLLALSEDRSLSETSVRKAADRELACLQLCMFVHEPTSWKAHQTWTFYTSRFPPRFPPPPLPPQLSFVSVWGGDRGPASCPQPLPDLWAHCPLTSHRGVVGSQAQGETVWTAGWESRGGVERERTAWGPWMSSLCSDTVCDNWQQGVHLLPGKPWREQRCWGRACARQRPCVHVRLSVWGCFWCILGKTGHWCSLRLAQGPGLWLEPGDHWGAERKEEEDMFGSLTVISYSCKYGGTCFYKTITKVECSHLPVSWLVKTKLHLLPMSSPPNSQSKYVLLGVMALIEHELLPSEYFHVQCTHCLHMHKYTHA